MLANNRISVIDNVGEFMPNLQNLFLMNNRIQDIKEVKKLVNCPQLTNLVLRNNPVCDSLNYKEMVISSLLSIKILDFRKISPQ
jgi:Leucine-rich repeat (LRR) protein